MDMSRFQKAIEEKRSKAGFEHVGTWECSECGYEYDLFKRRNTEEPPVYNCPKCAVKKEDERFAFDAAQERKDELQMDADRLNKIPLDIRNKTFDDYIPQTDLQKQAKELSVSYANNDLQEASLVFQGDTGIGKSHLTRCIAREFEERRQTFVFIDVPELMNKIKSSYGEKRTPYMNQERIMKVIANVDLLILDDIGAEYVKPDANGHESWAADIIFQIVNSRLGRQNIYTTNYTSKDLKRKYGMLSSRIISRMMNKAKVIKVDGEDQRLKGFE